MKVILFVDGDTERRVLPGFLKKWLDPKLEKPIKIQCEIFRESYFTQYGRIQLKQKIKSHLRHPSHAEIVAFIALTDLYGPNNSNSYPADKTSVADRVAGTREEVEKEINNPKFKMCFAVHELEAWLLSQPKIFPKGIETALSQNLKVKKPESVNFTQPPAKLLDELYRTKLGDRKYKKTTDGANLFAKLEPTVAYEKCPHLKEMLDAILSFAKTSAVSPQS
jgi:hypothetical protein